MYCVIAHVTRYTRREVVGVNVIIRKPSIVVGNEVVVYSEVVAVV